MVNVNEIRAYYINQKKTPNSPSPNTRTKVIFPSHQCKKKMTKLTESTIRKKQDLICADLFKKHKEGILEDLGITIDRRRVYMNFSSSITPGLAALRYRFKRLPEVSKSWSMNTLHCCSNVGI